VSFGKRATIYPGTAPLLDILQAEVSGKYNAQMQEGVNGDTETLVEGELGSAGQETTKRRGQMHTTGKTRPKTSRGANVRKKTLIGTQRH